MKNFPSVPSVAETLLYLSYSWYVFEMQRPFLGNHGLSSYLESFLQRQCSSDRPNCTARVFAEALTFDIPEFLILLVRIMIVSVH